MRISDWSSDVCSSDLSSKTKGGFGLPFFAEPPDCQETQIDRLRTSTARYVRERFIRPGQCFLALDRHGRGAALSDRFRRRSRATQRTRVFREIGRASCRERVWTYV